MENMIVNVPTKADTQSEHDISLKNVSCELRKEFWMRRTVQDFI